MEHGWAGPRGVEGSRHPTAPLPPGSGFIMLWAKLRVAGVGEPQQLLDLEVFYIFIFLLQFNCINNYLYTNDMYM